MGLELEAWYGSPWEPTESQRFILDAQREYATRDFPNPWTRLDKEAAAHQLPPREGGGLVLGRFYPPHLGHAFLIQVAERSIKGPLHVYVVSHPKKDVISTNWRQGMLLKKFRRPDSKVHSAVLDRPIQGSPEQPEFWQEWANWLRFQNLSPEIRTLFASDPQAQQLASALNLDFVLVDPERRTFPISATMIRKAPWEHWDFSLALWKQRLHGVEDKAMVKMFAKGELYLVLDDAPWKGPAQRDEPAARTAFVQSCLKAVRAEDRTPILISGPHESRAAAAIEAIDAWVRTNPAAWER